MASEQPCPLTGLLCEKSQACACQGRLEARCQVVERLGTIVFVKRELSLQCPSQVSFADLGICTCPARSQERVDRPLKPKGLADNG